MHSDQNYNISKLYKDNQNELTCYSYKFVKDWDTAEDLVQDLFLRISRKKLDNSFQITKSYLYICVKYRSLDYLRDKKSDPIELEYIEEFIPDGVSMQSLENATIDGIVIDDLQETIYSFEKKEIEIFHRKEYEGQKVSKISEDLNVTRYQVDQVLKKIKLRLREKIYDYNATDH